MRAQIDFVLAREGGWSDKKADRGGKTNCGITQPTLDEYRRIAPDAKAEVSQLRRDDAIAIYRWWWNSRELGLPLIKCPGVQLAVFDASVLFGRGRAAKWLQSVCNHLVGGLPLVVDGRVGPKTAAVANRLKSRDIILALDTIRRDHHMADVSRNPAQKMFITGWLNRCDHVRQAAIEMAIDAGNA